MELHVVFFSGWYREHTPHASLHNLHLQLPCICHLAPAVVIIGHSFFVGLELGIEALDLGITYGYGIEYAGIAKVLLLAILLMQIIARQICEYILLQLTHMRIGVIGNKMIAELGNLQKYRSIAICENNEISLNVGTTLTHSLLTHFA